MKDSSYGVFTLKIFDDDGVVNQEVKAYNDFTAAGFQKLMQLIKTPKYSVNNVQSTDRFSCYVKVGTGTSPNHGGMTDLENPTFGFYSERLSGGSIRDRYAVITAFDRCTLPPGTYSEIGLFDVDENNQPTDMLCRALFFTTPNNIVNPDVRRYVELTKSQIMGIGYKIFLYANDTSAYRLNFDNVVYDVEQTTSNYNAGNMAAMGSADPITGPLVFKYEAFASRSNKTEKAGLPCEVDVVDLDDNYLNLVIMVTVKNPYTAPRVIRQVTVNRFHEYADQGKIYRITTGHQLLKFNPPLTIPVGKQLKLKFLNGYGIGNVKGLTPYILQSTYLKPPVYLSTGGYSSNDKQYAPGIKRIDLFSSDNTKIATTSNIYHNNYGEIGNWNIKNNTYFNNNFIIRQQAYSFDDTPLNPIYYVPNQGATVTYTKPDVTMSSADMYNLKATPPTASITALRVFTSADGLSYVDIPTTAPNVVNSFPIPNVPYLTYADEMYVRWVGNDGIGVIQTFDHTYYRPIYGLTKSPNPDGTGFWIRALSDHDVYAKLTFKDGANVAIPAGDSPRKVPGEYVCLIPEGAVTVTYLTYADDGFTPTEVTVNTSDIPLIGSTTVNPLSTLPQVIDDINLVPPALDLKINLYKKLISVVFPADGTLNFYVSGYPQIAHSIEGLAFERVTFNYEDLIEFNSRGPMIVKFFDGVSESPGIYQYTIEPGTPDDLEIEYDVSENKLSVLVGYNTSVISIRRHLVPYIDIPIELGTTELEVILSKELDPDGRYEVYAISPQNIHSRIGAVIYPDNVDYIDPPIVDLSKIEDYVIGSGGYQGISSFPMPNFARYGTEAYAGEIGGEAITSMSAIEYTPGRWKCEIKTLNWFLKFQQYDGKMHNSSDQELNVLGYYESMIMDRGAPRSNTMMMWSTWVLYTWDGFNAFLNGADVNQGYVASGTVLGVTVQQQLSYYRMMFHTYSFVNSYADYKLYDHDLIMATADSKYNNNIALLVSKTANLDNVLIKIDNKLATVTRNVDPVTNLPVSVTISTVDYTFEHTYSAIDSWKIKTGLDRIGTPEWEDTVIKVQVTSKERQSTSYGQYHKDFIKGDVSPNIEMRYLNDYRGYWWNGFVYTPGEGNASWSFYHKPYKVLPPAPYVPPQWTSSVSFSGMRIGVEYGRLFNVDRMWFIDGVRVTPNQLSTNTDIDTGVTVTIYSLELGELKYSLTHSSDGQGYSFSDTLDIVVVNDDTNVHQVTFVDANLQFFYIYAYDNSSYNDEFAKNYNYYHLSMKSTSASVIPLVFSILAPLITDVNDSVPVGLVMFRASLDDVIINVDGVTLDYQTYGDGGMYGSEDVYFSDIEDYQDPAAIVLRLKGKYLTAYNGITDKAIVHIQNGSIQNAYSSLVNRCYGDSTILSRVIVDPSNSYNILSQIAFVLDASLYSEDFVDEDIASPVYDNDLPYSNNEVVPIIQFATIYMLAKVFAPNDAGTALLEALWMGELSSDNLDTSALSTTITDLINTHYTHKVDNIAYPVNVTVTNEYGSLTAILTINSPRPMVASYGLFDSYGSQWCDVDNNQIVGKVILDIEQNAIFDSRILSEYNDRIIISDNYNGGDIPTSGFNHYTYLRTLGNYYKLSVRAFLGDGRYVPPVIIDGGSDVGAQGIPPTTDTGFFSLDGLFELEIDGVIVGRGWGDAIKSMLSEYPDLVIEEDLNSLALSVFGAPNNITLGVEGSFAVSINGEVISTEVAASDLPDLLNDYNMDTQAFEQG